MNAPRRAFLRGLATLPLIGGSVAVIGNPTRADVLPSRDLLQRYVAWLANEHAAALHEFDRPEVRYIEAQVWPYYRVRTPLFWFPDAPDIERDLWATRPSSRAAVVLSAAGVDWKAPS